jgi:predicted nicotinamide N-methyase
VNPLRASLAEQLVKLRGDAPEALVDAIVERIELPGGAVYRARPRSFDAVREAEALAGPGRPTPYWSAVWTSGTALAEEVARHRLGGRRVLELGCGLGLPSVAAARQGASVTATDVSPEAVVYTAHNLALNDLEGEARAADWADLEGEWDLVMAADVLYRRDHIDPLLRALPRLLAPGGSVWIADSGRAGCRDFLAAARATWTLESADAGAGVRIHRLARRVR